MANVSGNAIINTNYYMIIEGEDTTFTKLGITPTTDVGTRKDIFYKADPGSILSIAREGNRTNSKTQVQLAMKTQQVKRQKAVITLVDTYTWKSKSIHKKVSILFPSACPVIFQTLILFNYITAKDQIKKFKGYYTWKRSPGGRFAMVLPPIAIINEMTAELLAARTAEKTTSRETTTVETLLED